jgi:curli biogenesis system outer membrane secretion channel CsgG
MLRSRRPSPLLPALLSALLLLPLALEAQERPRIAILQFQNNSTSRWGGDRLGAAATDELATQLVQTGEFSVVERERIQAIMAEQNLGMSGAVEPTTAAEIGKILGVQAMVLGSITKFVVDTKSGGIGPFSASFSEAETAVDVRVVSTESAEILMVAEGEGTKRFGGAAYEDIDFERSFDQGAAQEALRPAIENAVGILVESKGDFQRMAPQADAQVVGTREGDIYLDRGSNFGVEAGQRFHVFRVVDEIRDADGNLLDRVTDQVGTVEVTRVLERSSIARVVEGDAQEGDTLRPAG